MKKCLIFLLVLLVVVSVFSVSAAAASAGTVTVSVTTTTPNITILQQGGTQTLTLTYHVINNTNKVITALDIVVTGLDEGKFAVAGNESKAPNGIGNYGAKENKYSLMQANISNTEWDAFSLTLTVKDAAAKNDGNYTFGIDVGQSAVSFGLAESGTVAVGNSATVTVKHADAAHSWDEPSGKETKAATCQETGTKTYTCTVCGYVKTEDIPKKEHQWQEEPEWNWNGETAPFTNVVATLTCTGNGGGSHTVQKTATVTRGETTAKCTEAGDTTYTASVTFGSGDEGDGKTHTNDKKVNAQPLGHDWAKETITWDTSNPKAAKATLTVKCNNTDCEYNTAPYTTSESVSETASRDATCETDGYKDYKFEAKAPDTPDKTFTDEKKGVVIPATGHNWAAAAPGVTWEGDADTGKRTIVGDTTVKATCQNGAQHDGDDILTITYDSSGTPATCTTGGNITYTAKGVTPDGKKTYDFTDEQKTLKALGHDYEGSTVVFNWPTETGNGNKDTPNLQPTDAKLHCNRENTDITASGSVNVSGGTTPNVEPTYEKDGTYYWKATAQFPDGKGGNTEDKVEDNHPYTIPKLEPTFTNQDVANDTSGEVTTEAGVKDTLGADAKTVVENALTQDTKAGIDDTLYTVLKGAKEQGEGENLSVETQLVVEDKDLADAHNVAAEIGDDTLAQIYDIHIDVTVSGDTVNTGKSVGHITKVATPITFTVAKPEGTGPIWYVMRYHDGKWSQIESSVKGDKIIFSSDQFSEFALINSSDLAFAKIEPDPIPAQQWTGKAIEPKITVTINGGTETLELGKDYTISYENNVNASNSAKIIIKAVEGGDYTGQKEITFTITKDPVKATAKPSAAPTAPNTGDETPVGLYATVVIVCAAALTALVVVLVRRRRHQR